MKKNLCLFIFACAFAGFLSACTRDYSYLKPDHAGIRTGIDFEIQEGHNMKTKPGIHGSLDWDL